MPIRTTSCFGELIGDARIGRQVNADSFSKSNYHRSVYLPVVRDLVPESLSLFDFADPNTTNGQRDETNVPSQALYLMNSEFILIQAKAMAAELWQQHDSTSQRVKWAFIRAYGRLPDDQDVKASIEFFEKFTPTLAEKATIETPKITEPPTRRRPGQDGRKKGKRGRNRDAAPNASVAEPLDPEQQALVMFCQGLMASAEFRILD
jgi:hypothetical protein